MTDLIGRYRVTYDAPTEDGGSKRVTVMLANPSVSSGKHVSGMEVETISGRECDRHGDLTDRQQVIITGKGEAKIQRLVQDLVDRKSVV